MRAYIFINSELRESPHGRKLQHLRLLTKLGQMSKTSLRRLNPKEFDAALLQKLTREGRVYVDVPRVSDKGAYKREVLDYVQAIEDFVADGWRDQIAEVWYAIVDAACFRNTLTMKRGAKAGHMNRYAVTNLVCRLQHMGLYRSDVSMLTLHLQLEGVSKRNKYYESSGNYTIDSEARALLKQLLRRV